MPAKPQHTARHVHRTDAVRLAPWPRRAAAVLAATLLLAGPTAAATAAPQGSQEIGAPASAPGQRPSHDGRSTRGSLVSVTPLEHLTTRQVTATLQEAGLGTSHVRHGVDTIRVRYRTVDAEGRPTTASGLVVLPRTPQRQLRLVSYAHGTMATRSSAPSVDHHGRSAEGLVFGSAGYAVAAPDYLGLGSGPGQHPYLHARTQTTASVDMLRAADHVIRRAGHRPGRRVLVTGFSQGGAVAMQLAKALHRGALPGRRPDLVVPISGPYDLRGAQIPAMLAGRMAPLPTAYYAAYLLTSWHRLYDLGTTPGELFRKPYDTTVPPLFDGHHTEEEIVAGLPASFRELLTRQEVGRLAHPTGAFARALDENDRSCRGWTPGIRVRILAAHGDEQVAVDNAYSCQRDLADRGVRAPLVDLGDLDHNDSGRQGLVVALETFLRAAPPR